MKMFMRMVALLILGAFSFAAKPAEAQVNLGVARPGYPLGVGPMVGSYGGGFYPRYPVVVPPTIYRPRPVLMPPAPVYARPYYGRGPVYAPRYGMPRYYRR